MPVPYFHVVFTLPDALNGLAMGKPKEVYDTLFEAAWETVATFASDPQHLGAKAGMVSILHTWGQTLSLHPHLHCIVPGGGLTKQGKWKAAKGKKKSGKRKAKYLFSGKGHEQGV
ncbi:transposase [Cytophagaceae bacterium ABcell3]|nr:transposase [Cytophagaceae bacterium ABcell3]